MIENRIEAGKLLAKKLQKEENSSVVAIPRGGVIVGNEIAKKLGCAFDVAISKKISLPNNPEYAIGAITPDGTIYQTQNWASLSMELNFKDELEKKKKEVQRRLKKYRGNSNYDFRNKTIILVDDGIATGATVNAILNWLSKLQVKKIILAVPVMPADTYEMLKNSVSEIITIEIPMDFSSVGQFYEEFEQVSEKEVMKILCG